MLAVWFCWLLTAASPAIAGLNDDKFDGNIFALYGGNGALVPPKVSVEQALNRPDNATLLVFFLDDSRDCKQYSVVVSRLQSFYGKVTDFIPINVDSILPKDSYSPTEPGYYWEGVVPQTVLLDRDNQVVFNGKGQVPFEQVDDKFREVFDLLPRSESETPKRRPLNEVNEELQ
ncbi:thylakoid membrane photosystem I accumulation factor [Geitlerinema sp. PCC 9228]|uniref:thylakoid membrane photosystem I accumulation factor n=1 Tax=Geitlerinema sp. PCC 9228 TaxID=111611 RepID=UPI0031B9C627